MFTGLQPLHYLQNSILCVNAQRQLGCLCDDILCVQARHVCKIVGAGWLVLSAELVLIHSY